MTHRPVIYIAGPYSAETLEGIEQNIQNAETVALECWRAGWVCICPHKNTAGFHHATDIPKEVWYRGDLEILARCDALLNIDGWERSYGAILENDYATQNGILVFYAKNGIPDPDLVPVRWKK